MSQNVKKSISGTLLYLLCYFDQCIQQVHMLIFSSSSYQSVDGAGRSSSSSNVIYVSFETELGQSQGGKYLCVLGAPVYYIPIYNLSYNLVDTRMLLLLN